MKKKAKEYRAPIIAGIAAVIFALILFLVVIPLYRNAEEIGRSAGQTAGNAAGKAIGSFEGITTEIPKGLKDGEAEGLSAKDITAEITNQIQEIGKLQVLKAGISMDDEQKVGSEFEAVYLYLAEAVFSVDLTEAAIDRTEDMITITLPPPVVELYIDDQKTEEIVLWQKNRFSGSTEKGLKAYVNSRGQIDKEAAEKINNYEMLRDMAEQSAKTQLGILVGAICGEEVTLNIQFEGEEG